MELGPAEVVFDGPHHPYTEALLSAVPTVDGGGRERIRLEGDIPSAAAPPAGCVFHTRCPRKLGAICEETEPPLLDVEDGHLMRCHIPLEELRACSSRCRREDPRRCPRGARAGRSRCTSSSSHRPGRARCSCACRRAASATPTSTRSTAPPRRGAPRCSGTRARASSRPSARASRASPSGDHVALSWAPSCGECAECLRDLPQLCSTAWPAMGDGRADGRDDAPLARRRARLPLLASLDLRRGVRRARALVRADPARGAVRRSPGSSAARSRPASARSGGRPESGPAIASP